MADGVQSTMWYTTLVPLLGPGTEVGLDQTDRTKGCRMSDEVADRKAVGDDCHTCSHAQAH